MNAGRGVATDKPLLQRGARCAELELLLHCAGADTVNADHVAMLVQEELALGRLGRRCGVPWPRADPAPHGGWRVP